MSECNFKSGYYEIHLTDDGRLGMSVNDPRGTWGGIVGKITDPKAVELLQEVFDRAQATFLTPTETRIAKAVVKAIQSSQETD